MLRKLSHSYVNDSPIEEEQKFESPMSIPISASGKLDNFPSMGLIRENRMASSFKIEDKHHVSDYGGVAPSIPAEIPKVGLGQGPIKIKRGIP